MPPIIISATVSDGGFLLTGQDLKAFCTAVFSAGLWAVGLNCSFGADRLKPHLAELSAFAPCPVIAYPNAGLPDREGRYSDSPEIMANHIESWLKEGLVNIAGGCCGSAPAHIAAIAAKAENHTPRKIPSPEAGKVFLAGNKILELSGGLSALKTAGGSEEIFLRAVEKGDYEGAVEAARKEAEQGAEIFLLRPDTAPNPEEAVKSLIFLANCFPDLAKLPVCIESARPQTIEAGLACLQGRGAFKYTGNKNEDQQALKRIAKKHGAWT
jgi:5-methyltetrahydrofolate--homocysteine methyltransferase